MSGMKGNHFPDAIRDVYKRETNLLPEEWYPPPRWEQLRKPDSKSVKRDRFKTPLVFGNTGDDEWWQEWFPPRTKKDLSIRKLRWSDVYELAVETINESETKRRIKKLYGMDYIWSMNVMLAGITMPKNWWTRWEQRGTLEMEYEWFIEDTKMVSDLIKKNELKDKDWTYYVEVNCLAGYMNKGESNELNKFEEARKLAEGGTGDRSAPTGEDWDVYFEKRVRQHLYGNAPKVPYISFSKFVSNAANWETAGSSSEGKMEWEFDGKQGKFKVRKNLLPDIEDLDKIVNRCFREYEQNSVSFEKVELAKIRLAVASDIITYLRQTWLTYLTGHWYINWPGSTMEESSKKQYSRMMKMLQLSIDHYSLPFDYRAFDHQPYTSEVIAIIKCKHDVARQNVPDVGLKEFEEICSLDLKGYLQGYITTKESKEGKMIIEKVRVTGGLPSGLRDTTIIGNGWNTVMTNVAKEWLEEITNNEIDLKYYIRGDDTANYLRNYYQMLLLRSGYAVAGAEGNNSKFGIHRHASEFLRIWYSNKAQGYPARTLPNITQRKPQNSEPLDASLQWIAQRNIIDTLIRRGLDKERLEMLWTIITTKWASHNHVNKKIFSTPRPLGGMGVEAWDGKEKVGPLPNTDNFKIKFTNTNQYRERVWTRIASEVGIDASQERIKEIVQQDRMSKVNADEIMSFTAIVRPYYKKELKRVKRHTVEATPNYETIFLATELAEEPQLAGSEWLRDQEASYLEYLREELFGRAAGLMTRFDEIRKLAPNLTIRATLKHMDAKFGSETELEWQQLRKHLPPMDAKEWLFGNFIPSQPTGLNGMFDKLCQLISHFSLVKTWKGAQFRRRNDDLYLTMSKTIKAVSQAMALSMPVKVLNGW